MTHTTNIHLKLLVAILVVVVTTVGISLYQRNGSEPLATSEVIKTVAPIDEDWNRYTNHQLGFSINLPKQTLFALGNCQWDEVEGSYQRVSGLVPVKTFEDAQGSIAHIAPEYFYELTGESREEIEIGLYISRFSGCDRVMNALARLSSERWTSWAIEMRSVKNNRELLSYLQERYGSSCRLGEQTPTHQVGVYDVSIFSDGKDLVSTGCLINFRFAIKYAPQKQKVFAWDLGQENFFFGSDNEPYDDVMIESFLVE